MDDKFKKLLEKTKGNRVGIFIDNSNWFYPQKELGWKISFSKLKNLLASYYKLKALNLYAGTPLDGSDQKTFQKFVQALKYLGFEVKTKPLKKIWLDREHKKFVHKCNFDVEIALDVARTIKDLDLIILGSGDSDFLAVKDFALENKKLFIAPCFERGVAWEVRKGYHIFLEDIRDQVEQD